MAMSHAENPADLGSGGLYEINGSSHGTTSRNHVLNYGHTVSLGKSALYHVSGTMFLFFLSYYESAKRHAPLITSGNDGSHHRIGARGWSSDGRYTPLSGDFVQEYLRYQMGAFRVQGREPGVNVVGTLLSRC